MMFPGFSRRACSFIWSVWVVAYSPVSATTFVVDRVQGPYTSLSSAVAAASADTNTPHEIRIVDGGTYLEDVYLPPPHLAPNLSGVRIAGVPDPATVIASNTRADLGIYGILVSIAFGPTPDGGGMVIEADGTVVENLVLIQPGGYHDPVDHRNSAVTIAATDVSLRNCRILGDSGSGTETAVQIYTGTWSELDFWVTAGVLTARGYPAEETSDGLLIENCEISGRNGGDSTIGLDSTDLSLRYLVLAGGMGGAYYPPIHPAGVSVVGCEFRELDETARCSVADGWVVTRCRMARNRNPFTCRGGTWVFSECVFEDFSSGSFLALEAEIVDGGGFSSVVLDDCYFCGESSQPSLIRVSEGTLSLNRCIAVLPADGTATAWVVHEVDDIDPAFGALAGVPPGPPPPVPATTAVSMNHCDFHGPEGRSPVIRAEGDLLASNPSAEIRIRNSILTLGPAVSAVEITGSTIQTSGSLFFQYNDFYGTGVPILDNSPGWTVILTGNLNVDPRYRAAGPCVQDATSARALYGYADENVAAAGESGSGLGSQPPVPRSASVGAWSLYE